MSFGFFVSVWSFSVVSSSSSSSEVSSYCWSSSLRFDNKSSWFLSKWIRFARMTLSNACSSQNKVISFWVILRPVAAKKYQCFTFSESLYIFKLYSLYSECLSVIASNCCNPSVPAPLKSVAGSFPWKPMSTHSIDFLSFKFTCGLRLFHSLKSFFSWVLTSFLNYFSANDLIYN